MITQQKASVLPAHIFKNISLGVIVCSLTTQLFLIKSLLCCVFWNQGAAMPNSVEKGTAVLWLKSSQLKLCFCFGKKKRKKSQTQRRVFLEGTTQEGVSGRLSGRPRLHQGPCQAGSPRWGYRGWTLCSLSPSLETLGTRRPGEPPDPHSHLQPPGASCWEPHISSVTEYGFVATWTVGCSKALRGLRCSLRNQPGL